MNWIGDCFARPNCASTMSTVAMLALAVVGIAQAVVLTLTWLAIRSSTKETSFLRQETAKQVRLSALPILQVIFHKGPDKVFLRNISMASAASAASRALLQGFRFSWNRENRETWRCTFNPTGMIAPGQETRLEVQIEREPVEADHERVVPGNQVFTAAFNRAFSIERPNIILALHFEDMLGNCYRSEVEIDREEIPGTDRQETRPTISRTTLVERFPESLELVDVTTQPAVTR